VYGISEDSYHGTVFAPLFGTGQGSGASPSAWLTLVVILLQTLDRLIPDRINFSSPKGDIQHSRLSDAFVDDTYLGFTSSDDTATLESLISRLQDIAQTWEHLLFLSGGKLNLSKCSWYILRWEWEQGRPSLRPILATDPQLRLRQGSSDKLTTIRQSKLEDSQRMLGVLLNPLGDFGAHIQFLKNKADTFAHRLLSPRLTASDVRIFHRSTHIPSMRYGLAAVALDEEVLRQVQSKVIQSILKKLHVQSMIPTAIRHGPAEFGGLDIYDLRTEAGLEAIKFFRDSLFSGSENGKLIRLNLQYSQIESGIGQPLLAYPGIHVSYLTPTWLMSLRQFLYCHNLSITVTNEPGISLQGPQDQYIMQAQHLARYSASQQRDLNLVRMYLQVHTLAAMSHKARKQAIDVHYLDAVRPPDFVVDESWPRQSVPSNAQRRLWKRFIRSSYLRYVPFWTSDPRAGITLSAQKSRASATANKRDKNFSEYLTSLPKTHRRLLDGYEQIASDTQIWKAFRSRRRLHFATDGGLHSQKGTHGWIISTGSKTLFQCAGPVDGPMDTSSSTRSELGGYASALVLIRALSHFWGRRHSAKLHWYCDSKAAISRVRRFALRYSRTIKMPDDADLISLIRSCHNDLRKPICIHWIKGHQDSDRGRNLSLGARLNIQADLLATGYRKTGRLQPSTSVHHELDQVCSISINGKRLTSQYDACVRFHINGYHLRTYLQEKHGWSNIEWDLIDFHVFGRHFRQLQPHKQATWMKFVHDQLPLGERRYKQATEKASSLRKCPCCKTSNETISHLLQCTSNPEFLSSLSTLHDDLCKTEAHPVRHLLYAGIHHHATRGSTPFHPSTDSYPHHLHPLIQECLISQAKIGWDQATKGFFSVRWRELASRAMFQTNSMDPIKGQSCMRAIADGIYEHNIRLWKSRNEILHSREDIDLQSIRSAETAEISKLYEQPDSLCFSDRYLCSRSLEGLLRSTPATRRRWLRRVKASRDMHIKDGSRQVLLTSCFPTTASNQPRTASVESSTSP
jgi:hypothetical protein